MSGVKETGYLCIARRESVNIPKITLKSDEYRIVSRGSIGVSPFSNPLDTRLVVKNIERCAFLHSKQYFSQLHDVDEGLVDGRLVSQFKGDVDANDSANGIQDETSERKVTITPKSRDIATNRAPERHP